MYNCCFRSSSPTIEEDSNQSLWEEACFEFDTKAIHNLLNNKQYPDYWLPILKIVCIKKPCLKILEILVEEEGLLNWTWENNDDKVYVCTLKHQGVLNYSAPDYILEHVTNPIIYNYLFNKVKCYNLKSNGLNKENDKVTYKNITIIYSF